MPINSKSVAAIAAAYGFGIAGFYAVVAHRTRHGMPDACSLRDDASVGRQRLPRVSIVLPARNEERNVRECVSSLLDQDYPDYQVIVVDDASEDATPAILQEMAMSHPNRGRLAVVHVASLPEGWAGKPHALHTGATQATGDLLLFTDADTRHAPDTLSCAVGAALATEADLLSLATRIDTPDFWSRVLMPFAFMGISMMYPAARVRDPKSRVAIANGQFILIRRQAYDNVGGYAHPDLRATVVDDRDLAAAVKRKGGHLVLVDGRKLVRVRMYQNFAEQWEGWGKNAYAGSRGGMLFYVLMIAGVPATGILPFVLLGALPLARGRFVTPVAIAAVPSVAASLVFRMKLNAELGVPRRYIWTHPLAAAVFTGILIRSAWRVRTGRGVIWRGRTFQV